PFVWTLARSMQACARVGVGVVALDRPTPLGGAVVEGNVPDPAFASFVGLYPLTARHGLTIGELAAYLNERHALGCNLTVAPLKGWRRAMLWEDTGLPWVAPSPNMPTPDTARVYPGGCLVEGTNLSEGRGTTRPFEWIGAPYLDAHRYADALEAERLPGVRFRPARFVPTFPKWAGRLCDGAQLHVTDRAPPTWRTGDGALAPEEAREELLHAPAEVYGAVTDLLPGALGRVLHGFPCLLARLLERRARGLRALDDGLADALRRLLDTLADLLGTALHLFGGGLHFRVGGGGRQAQGEEKRAREYHGQRSHATPPDDPWYQPRRGWRLPCVAARAHAACI